MSSFLMDLIYSTDYQSMMKSSIHMKVISVKNIPLRCHKNSDKELQVFCNSNCILG